MAAEAKTEEKETELDVEVAKEKEKLQEQQDYITFKSLTKFEQKDIANILKTEALSKRQVINVYKEIQDDCNQCGFLITPMEKLPEMKSCILTTHNESPKAMINISCALYRRFTIVIPSTNKVMIDMTQPFAKNRDGYAYLWSLMRRSCQFIKPEPEGWGPEWPSNATLEKYVVELQAYCSVTNVKCQKVYTCIQQSKEILHQAALLYNQAIATKLDNNLSIWKSTHLNEALPGEWRIEGLVDKFADYKHIIMLSGPVGKTPSINLLNNKND